MMHPASQMRRKVKLQPCTLVLVTSTRGELFWGSIDLVVTELTNPLAALPPLEPWSPGALSIVVQVLQPFQFGLQLLDL